MKCNYCSCVLPKVPPPLNQPFCGRCGHAVSDHFVATGTTAASSTKSTTRSSLLFPDVLGVSDPPKATLTEPAKRKSELNSAYTTQNTKKVKGSEVQIEIWKIDLEFSKKVFKDKPQLAEAMINAREKHLLKPKKVFDHLPFSEVVKTTFPEVRGYRVFTARKNPNKAREIIFGEAENVKQSTIVPLMYLFNNEKLFMILPWVSSILGIIY